MTPGPTSRWRRLLTPTALGMAVVVVAFAWLVWHRRWISDDGMIVVRTVRETLAGNGPVYNVFERAEPNTSTLWTYILVLVGWVTGWPMSLPAVLIGGLFAVGGALLGMDAARRWHRARGAAGPLAPAGVLILLGASPFWDFATSGLENGLGQLWLALAWWLLVALRDGGTPRQHLVAAVVFGLGPLVRPDFAVASGVFAAAAWLLARPRLPLRRVLVLAGTAAALPVAYEIFRAGYYGALVPLPALAKSASASNWGRGILYLGNFLHTYWVWLPLAVLAVVLVVGAARRQLIERDRVVAAAPIVAGLIMALYVVRVGGDFMHSRLMLPATFTMVLPAMLLPVTRRTAAALVVLVGWTVVIGLRHEVRGSRVAPWIMDEWTGYRAWTKRYHPIDPRAFVAADRPGSQTMADALRDGRRRLVAEDNDLDVPMNPALPGPGVYAAGRLGTGGAVMPLDGIVADTLGLANPFGARITQTASVVPGHEKPLPRAWLLAIYGDPAFDTSHIGNAPPAMVASARRALQCGEIAELLASARAPLTAARFWDNLVGAVRRTRLVIPSIPFEAETRFCGTPAPARASSSHELEGWSLAYAVDGAQTSVPGALGYSSKFSDDGHPEWIAVRVPARKLSKVVLHQVNAPGFPSDFRIQIWDGAVWVDRVVKTDYAPAGNGPQEFSWSPADTTDEVRIYATKLRKAQPGYALQLAEIETAP